MSASDLIQGRLQGPRGIVILWPDMVIVLAHENLPASRRFDLRPRRRRQRWSWPSSLLQAASHLPSGEKTTNENKEPCPESVISSR